MAQQYWLEEYRKKAELKDPVAQSGRGNQFNAVEFLYVVKEAVELLDLRREHDLLDVGCANGLLEIPLSAMCRRIFAVEPVPELVELARRNLADCPNVQVEVGHGGAVPAADGSFDRALALGVIQLVAPEDARAMFAELYRVTRPGGRVVFASVLNAHCRDAFLTPYLDGVRQAAHLSGGQKAEITRRNLSAYWHKPEELSGWWAKLGGSSEVLPLPSKDPNAGHRFHLALTVAR